MADLFLIVIVCVLLYRNKKYKETAYYQINGNSYSSVKYDKRKHGDALEKLKREHTKITDKLNRLTDLRLEGKINGEEFKAQKARLKDRQFKYRGKTAGSIFRLFESGTEERNSLLSAKKIRYIPKCEQSFRMAGVPGFEPGIKRSKPYALPLGYTPIESYSVT